MNPKADPQPDWYRDAIIYEIAVRAFADSNADGTGDFRGLTERLDYVKDLGVTALWLLPFYPSPLRDGGYDIADFKAVDPMYGTLDDFKRFLDEAHRRDLKVITELVINHTSDQHPWFQRARRSPPGSPEREWYVWAEDPSPYRDARIIFQDYETSNWTWDPIAKAYFWHRFYSHQPDLNFDNPEVRREVLETCGFWLEMGVDGMRLDAIPYLYEREGTNCENLPETHAFLKQLRSYIDANFEDRMLLAEANQWPEDAAAYFGDGDECHMNFHFPLMPRMFMSVQLESSAPIHEILSQTPTIPEGCQWAIFLRNHDELTLEMVTDEDRDFMYEAYAADPQMRVNLGIRRRLAPLLGTRGRVELMKTLLFSFPGTPVLYYGDEIGMGDNIYLGDRDAVRTPMQWSADRNGGFSKANPQKLYLPTVNDPLYHHASVNVETQQDHPESLLSWVKHAIALRKNHPVFGRGELELLPTSNGKVLAFLRYDDAERVLVVANLSRHSQFVELDLSDFAGTIPVELFGNTRFPQIGDLPYLLTLGPNGYYWFLLTEEREESGEARPRRDLGARPWTAVLDEGPDRRWLEARLARWMPDRRWYRGKARDLESIGVREVIPVGRARLAIVEVAYRDGARERVRYLVPLAFAQKDDAATLLWRQPHAVIAELDGGEGEGLLFDAAAEEDLGRGLARLLAQPDATAAPLHGHPVDGVDLTDIVEHPIRSSEAEQSNTSLLFDDAYILKLFRVVEAGDHPEVELGAFLSAHPDFTHTPRLLGSVSYAPPGETPATVAVLHELVPKQGDGWELGLEAASLSLERAAELRHALDEALPTFEASDPPPPLRAMIGAYLAIAARLGERTGALHLALADAELRPEPLSLLHQREMYQSVRTRLREVLETLRRKRGGLEGEAAALADRLLSMEGRLDARLKRIYASKIDAHRTRIHGDLHLGQVLIAGSDLLFIDFEGEPARSLKSRRRPRSPLRDVAGMLRSFDYAMEMALRQQREEDRAGLEPYARAWVSAVSAAYLDEWRKRLSGARSLPKSEEALRVLLDFHLLQKCIYEVGYELNNRPEWVATPLASLVRTLEEGTW
jgi:maltose alpha-D-glucosyltransferase/alpha-amylase